MFERPADVRWPDQGRFILAAVGMAMGLAAFTSFAGAALGHGGGAFLIAYLVAVATAAVPVLVLEFGIGLCYQASAPVGLRRLDRRLEWLGWWITALAGLAVLTIVAQVIWAAHYGFDSLMSLLGNRPLPWGRTPESAAIWFSTSLGERPISGAASAAAALAPVGSLVVIAAMVWLAVHRLMAGGLTAIGRWSLAVIPTAAVLLIVVGVTVLYQPGAVDGVAAFLTPRWSALLELDTWLAAYRTAFTTHAVGLGVYIAYASHLKRGSDASGSALVVGLAGAGFAFLAGMVVSAAAGALAGGNGVPLEQLANAGPRAVFSLLPTLCATLPLAAWVCALLALLLCVCWIMLLLSSALGLIAAITLALADKWGWSWSWVNARICLGGFFASVVFTSAAGPTLVEVLHDGLLPFGVAAAVSALCLGLTRVGGGANLERHLNAYSVIGVGRGWRMLVRLATPLVLLGLIIERSLTLSTTDVGAAGAGLFALLVGITLALSPGRRLV